MSDWIESKSPAFIAAGVGMLAGVCLLGYGAWSMFQPDAPPAPFSVAMALAGAAEWLLCFLAVRRSRAAWSFALAVNGVGFVVFLFGAPKVRDGLDTSLLVGVAPALIFLVITVLFGMASREYSDRG